MPPAIADNRGKKTEFARRAIIRYIHDARLRNGDRLPSQQELCQSLKLSSSTIIRAIQLLRDTGVLTVRDKVGVFVNTDKLDGLIGRTIGLLAVTNSELYIQLSQALHQELLASGCRIAIFNRKLLSEHHVFDWDDVPGLKAAIEAHHIDGLIDMNGLVGEHHDFVTKHQIPVSYVGAPWPAVSGIIIDMKEFIRRSLRRAWEMGLVCPALVVMRSHISEELRDVFEEALRVYPEDVAQKARRFFLTVPEIREGRKLAWELLKLPQAERPDALILADEYIGSDLLCGLAVVQGGRSEAYRPQVFVSRSSLSALTFPVIAPPILLALKDPRRMAQMVCEHLLSQLRTGIVTQRIEYYCYEPFVVENFFPTDITERIMVDSARRVL